MVDDFDSAVDRLSYAILQEPDRKISFLYGSGLSLPSVPSASDIVKLFCDELGISGQQLKKKLDELEPGPAYQKAAYELRQRRGERGLASVVKKAVMQARQDPLTDFEDNFEEEGWILPKAQDLLGKLVSIIPSQQRGPLFTTNFDPLTEIALEKHGVKFTTLAVSYDTNIALESIYGSLPVVHVHGFWRDGATLNTSEHLERHRPAFENTLQIHLSKTLMVIMGYSGWVDSFSRALENIVKDGRLSAMQGELLWMNYSSNISSQLLSSIVGAPGVNVYKGIDANEYLQEVSDVLYSLRRKSRTSYSGWQAVPMSGELREPLLSDIKSFMEGAQPTWEVTEDVPNLSGTKRIVERVVEAAEYEDKDLVIAISGPTGEGKSTALMQVAASVRNLSNEHTVIYRQPSAPRMSAEWLQHLREQSDITFLFVDDADLIINELSSSYHQGTGGRLVFVFSIHSSYESILISRGRAISLPIEFIQYDHFETDDAYEIASYWKQKQVLPSEHEGKEIQSIAKLIIDSGTSEYGKSLFGAVLNIWMGENLQNRIEELLIALEKKWIKNKNFRELLCSIAIFQVATMRRGGVSTGISLQILGDLCGLENEEVVPYVIAPLGREVGISQIGEFVFVRHPSIAQGIVSVIRKTGESNQIAFQLGKSGGRIRDLGEAPTASWKTAYRLYDGYLTREESFQVARGAAIGAPNRLEPRVSLLAVARKNDRLELAQKYAAELLEHLDDFMDKKYNVRGLYVERAMIDKTRGHLHAGLRNVVIALSDLEEAPLSRDNVGYALLVAESITGKLDQLSAGARELRKSILDLLEFVPEAKSRHPNLSSFARERGSLLDAVNNFRLTYPRFAHDAALARELSFKSLIISLSTN